MEITVVKEFTFDAAHYLPNHPGKCQNTHGHTYRLQIGVKGPVDIEEGMVMDFGMLKDVVNDYIVEYLDHKYLNNFAGKSLPNAPHGKIFPHIPTAEAMVEWMVVMLEDIIEKETEGLAKLQLVRLYETPTSYAEWRKEG